MKKYDFIIVGAGLSGAVTANILKEKGYSILIVDKRHHVGGNCHTKITNDGIGIHWYGAHIFHTSNKNVWDYVNKFAEFNNFINSPLACYDGKLYSLPFNMYTFNKLWGVRHAEQAKEIISKQKQKENIKNPKNLEEKALSMVGREIYEKFIKGYTEKQWNKSCKDLPESIINRIPLRFTYNNNYFNDKYQGIPIGGYTKMVEKMIDGCDLMLGIDFLESKDSLTKSANIAIIYTGAIDEYFNYKLGVLEYRSLKFDHEKLNYSDFQSNAVINYNNKEIPYTRIIEHKYFDIERCKSNNCTHITFEYPIDWKIGLERYYPINTEKNNNLYEKYKILANKEHKINFLGRLGKYQYLDMDKTIEQAIEFASKFL